VEDPSASDGAFHLREADLEKHLTNDKPSDSKPSTAGKNTVSAPSNKGTETAKPAAAEFGSKNDYQLNQALNLLKGMQILHGS